MKMRNFVFLLLLLHCQETTEKALSVNIHFRIYLESLYAQSEDKQLSFQNQEH